MLVVAPGREIVTVSVALTLSGLRISLARETLPVLRRVCLKDLVVQVLQVNLSVAPAGTALAVRAVSLVCFTVELEKLKPSVNSSGIVDAGDFAAASICP